MSQKQQEVAKVILEDPAVESLSSFIGVDGTNTTMNSGRFSINLKPLSERELSASDVIRRIQPKIHDRVQGFEVYMQPVQDITVDDRVSRTQYQYTLEDPDVNELNDWTNKFLSQMKKMPELEDLATDQQTGGLAVSLVIDRVTASRLGIATATIDNALYDAFGQRQISTMYTQLNQYHVILEALPTFQTSPDKLQSFFCNRMRLRERPEREQPPRSRVRVPHRAGSNAAHAIGTVHTHARSIAARASANSSGAKRLSHSNLTNSSQMANAVPLDAFTHLQLIKRASYHYSPGQFPAVTISFNLAPGHRSARPSAKLTSCGRSPTFPRVCKPVSKERPRHFAIHFRMSRC